MSTIIESKDKFKSGYMARVMLVPVTVTNPAAGREMIRLEVSGNKSLPGVDEAEEWEFKTDNPEQEVAEKIIGKMGGMSALNFEVPYDPVLLQKLIAHASTKFTVRIFYDDAELPDQYLISVLGCFLKTPGSTSGVANAAAPTMNVILQPRGGGLLKDSMDVIKTPRP